MIAEMSESTNSSLTNTGASSRRDLRKSHRLGKAARYAVMLMVAAIYAIPTYWMFLEAFRNLAIISFPPDFNPLSHTSVAYLVSNVEHVWNVANGLNASFPLWYLNSVYVAAITVGGSVGIGSMAGYAFARLKFRGRDILFYVVLGTMMIPFPVITISLYLFMNSLGWVSTYQGLIAPQIASALTVFLMRQYFLTLPTEVEDAAKVDGLRTWQIFYQIALPMARPALAACIIFTFIGSWNNLIWPAWISLSPSVWTLPLSLKFFTGANGVQIYWNQMMTAVVLTIIPTLLIFALFERFWVQGISLSGSGSVK